MHLDLLVGTPSTKETQFHKAELKDITLCVKLVKEFFEKTSWQNEIPLDENEVIKFIVNHIVSDSSLVLVGEESFMLGTLIPSLINPSVVIAQEVVWYGKEGNEMLKEFEEWAKKKGASFVALSSIVDDKEQAIRRLYRKNGYKPMETAYIKGVL